MDLYQLEYFKALCYYKNYTLTAKYFDVTQPSITVAIKKLEKELGSTLINRTSKDFSLTPFGEVVLHHANVIHDEADAIFEAAKEWAHQSVTPTSVGVPLTLCPKLLNSIVTQYMPTYKERPIMIYQSAAENIADQISHGLLDMGVVSQNMLSPLYETKYLDTVEFCAFFSENSKLAGLRTVSPENLRDEQLLINDTTVGVTALLADYLHEHGLGGKLTHLGNMLPNDAYRFARQGVGVAFLSRDQFAPETDCFAALSPPLTIDLYLVYRRSKVLSQADKNLISFITRFYKENSGKL